MKMNRVSVRVWRSIAAVARPLTMAEARDLDGVADAIAQAHSKLTTIVFNLVQGGYLTTDGAGRLQATFWFGQHCKLPEGEGDMPRYARPVDSSRAAPRGPGPAGNFDAPEYRSLRPDAYDYLKHPSRRGDRLYYRDGRVTDLQGNPIDGAAGEP
jgi:hypothetical protein